MSGLYIGQMRTGTKALLGGAVITVGALAVLVALVVLLVAPYAHADATSYYRCVTNTRGISGNQDTIVALGREAWNATGGSNNGSAGAFEAMALSKKYQLSENVASSIVMCALQYGPIS